MSDFLALVRLDVFNAALRAPVIAATTPDISPLFAIFGAAIIIDELSLGHSPSISAVARLRKSLQEARQKFGNADSDALFIIKTAIYLGLGIGLF